MLKWRTHIFNVKLDKWLIKIVISHIVLLKQNKSTYKLLLNVKKLKQYTKQKMNAYTQKRTLDTGLQKSSSLSSD
jgi:hypothetical protein